MARVKLSSQELNFINGSDFADDDQRVAKMAASTSTFTFTGQGDGTAVTLANVADPTNDQDCATKSYVDAQVNGLQWKASCRVVATSNITLSGTQTIDGVAVAEGDRVLVVGQSAGSEHQHGIYVCASGPWSRAADFDDPNNDNVRGAAVLIREGTTNADRAYQCTTDGAISFGTTAISFASFVNTAGTLADSVVTTAKLADLAVSTAKIADLGVTNDKLAGSIANGKLVNSAISGKELGTNLDSLSVVGDSGLEMTSFNGSAAVTDLKIKSQGVVTAMIADDAVTLTKMAGLARGSLILGDSSGNPSALATGLADTVLKSDGTDSAYGKVTSAMIQDATIVNGDVSATAAIEFSKMEDLNQGSVLLGNVSNKAAALDAKGDGKLLIGNGTTVTSVGMSGDISITNAGLTAIVADAVHASMLNDDVISGQTELAHADIADADEMLISNGGTLKRVGVDSLQNHFFGAVSGDAAIADGGALTIAANAVEHSMLNNNVISGLTALESAEVAQADELMFSDEGTLKKITFSNFEDSIFANVSGDATIAAGGALTIGADAVQTGMLHDDCATGLAGAGLTATTGVLNIISGAGTGLNVAADAMNLDMNDLSEGAINVANDSFAFVDADGGDATKKESIADLMTAIAGDAITASAGVLAVGVDNLGIEINSDALRLKDDGVTYAKLQNSTQGFAVLGKADTGAGGHDEIAFTQAGAVLARNYTGNLTASSAPEVASLTVGTATEQVKLSAAGTNGANGQLQLNVASGNRSLTMSGNINVGGDFTVSTNDFTINALAAGKTLAMNESLTIGDGFDGTLTFAAGGKTLTVSETVTLNQSVSTTDSVEFADVSVSSDISLKTNIQTIENGLDVVNAIEPVTWDWKTNGEQSSGIIAQQLEETLPFLIKNGEHKRVNYNGLHGYLISAIKELSKQVNELKQ
jgi:hypothetical protein